MALCILRDTCSKKNEKKERKKRRKEEGSPKSKQEKRKPCKSTNIGEEEKEELFPFAGFTIVVCLGWFHHKHVFVSILKACLMCRKGGG